MFTYEDLGRSFTDLAENQSFWSQETFGSDDTRGPVGALLHLEKEAREAIEAFSSSGFEEEMADCFLLVLDAARRGKMNPMDLIKAAERKMIINEQRKWPMPVTDVPVEHIE
jgi:hypothetical protein